MLFFTIILSAFVSCGQAQSATDGTEPTEGTTLTPSEPTAETDPLPTANPTEPTAPEPEPMLTLDPDNMPEDFSFNLRFGVYASNSYDSATGKTHKVCQKEDVDKYTTTFIMSDEQLRQVYSMLSQMDIGSYPDEYDPINDPNAETSSSVEPEEVTELTVYANGVEKKIRALTQYQDKGYDERAQAFLDVCRFIEHVVKESEEWKALPKSNIAFL